MTKILFIIDPEYDFIEGGSLAVSGGTQSLENLAKYLNSFGESYDWIFVTADKHPKNHCSFVENGGPWPVHCVKNTKGSSIYEPLKRVLDKFAPKVGYAYKGMKPDVEQYSVFCLDANGEITNEAGVSIKRKIDSFSKHNYMIDIDICGLAGDFCVHDTLSDLVKLYHGATFNVIEKCTASIDGGEKLDNFKKTHNVGSIMLCQKTREEVKDTLYSIIKDCLGLEYNHFTRFSDNGENLLFSEELKPDLLEWFDILGHIEETFNVSLSDSEFENCKTVRDIIDLIYSKL